MVGSYRISWLALIDFLLESPFCIFIKFFSGDPAISVNINALECQFSNIGWHTMVNLLQLMDVNGSIFVCIELAEVLNSHIKVVSFQS